VRSATHKPTLVVHGGAWAIPDDAAAAHESGVRKALEAGFAVLSRGGASVDAVEAAVTVMEDDPTFDAGGEVSSPPMVAFNSTLSSWTAAA